MKNSIAFALIALVSFTFFPAEANDPSENANRIVYEQVVKEPEPPQGVKPLNQKTTYPRQAIKNDQGGWVHLSFNVEPDGSVSNVEVINSRGGSVFERIAVRNVKAWRYEPSPEGTPRDVIRGVQRVLGYELGEVTIFEPGESELFEPRSIQPIKRPVRFPARAARKFADGWVHLRFTIHSDGSVSSPSVIDSFGGEEFEQAALRDVVRWKYEPAPEGATRPDIQNFEQVITYVLEGAVARNKFLDRYNQSADYLEDGELAKAKAELDALRKELDLNSYENTFYHLAYARYFLANGEGIKALNAMRNALNRLVWKQMAGTKKQQLKSLLPFKFKIEAGHGALRDALQTYEDMKDIGVAKNDKDVQEIYQALVGMTQNPQPFGASGLIINGKWHHRPLRREFGFRSVNGKLETIFVGCDYHTAAIPFELGLTWKLPDHWGNCAIEIRGAEQSSFQIVEYTG